MKNERRLGIAPVCESYKASTVAGVCDRCGYIENHHGHERSIRQAIELLRVPNVIEAAPAEL